MNIFKRYRWNFYLVILIVLGCITIVIFLSPSVKLRYYYYCKLEKSEIDFIKGIANSKTFLSCTDKEIKGGKYLSNTQLDSVVGFMKENNIYYFLVINETAYLYPESFTNGDYSLAISGRYKSFDTNGNLIFSRISEETFIVREKTSNEDNEDHEFWGFQ